MNDQIQSSSTFDDPFNDTRMSLGDHIEELRKHLIRALLGFGVALVAGFFLSPMVLAIHRGARGQGVGSLPPAPRHGRHCNGWPVATNDCSTPIGRAMWNSSCRRIA